MVPLWSLPRLWNYAICCRTRLSVATARGSAMRPLYCRYIIDREDKVVCRKAGVKEISNVNFDHDRAPIIVVLIIWAIGIYNSLISMRQRVNQAYADIDVQLRQRHDLVPNLVETVKGYAAHERGTLDEVVKARNA